jgi:hypothetical protein
MIRLIIDTCVWIELCKKFPELREKITLLVEQKKVRLILPSIILEEWNRQKPRIIEERNQSIRGMIKNARSISEYLDPEFANNLRKTLEELPGDKLEKTASAGIQEIEHVFSYPTTVVLDVTDTAKLHAVDSALAKKAPFRSKNSMADALIIFCATEYLANEGLSDCIFVSSNSQDFSSSSNPNEVHEDLRELFERHGIRYFTNIGLAINEVEADLVSAESVRQVEETVKLDAIRESLQSIHAYDQQLMNSIREAGGLSVIQETFRLADEANRQFMESVKAAVESVDFSVMEEAFRTILERDHQLMESIKAAVEFPNILDAIQVAMENIKAAGGLSVVEEAVYAIQEHNRKLLMEALETAQHPSHITSSTKIYKVEATKPDDEDDNRTDNLNGV